MFGYAKKNRRPPLAYRVWYCEQSRPRKWMRICYESRGKNQSVGREGASSTVSLIKLETAVAVWPNSPEKCCKALRTEMYEHYINSILFYKSAVVKRKYSIVLQQHYGCNSSGIQLICHHNKLTTTKVTITESQITTSRDLTLSAIFYYFFAFVWRKLRWICSRC